MLAEIRASAIQRPHDRLDRDRGADASPGAKQTQSGVRSIIPNFDVRMKLAAIRPR